MIADFDTLLHGRTSVTVRELFEAARVCGELIEELHAPGIYECTIVKCDIRGETKLDPLYRTSAGAYVRSFAWNLTPQGMRRFTSLCKAWGVVPTEDDGLETIAARLGGAERRCRIGTKEFAGKEWNTLDVIR